MPISALTYIVQGCGKSLSPQIAPDMFPITIVRTILRAQASYEAKEGRLANAADFGDDPSIDNDVLQVRLEQAFAAMVPTTDNYS